MIARSDERAGGHFFKTHPPGQLAEMLELFRRDIADHRHLIGRGLQVLAEGQPPAAGLEEIGQRVEQFLGRFAQPEHQARL